MDGVVLGWLVLELTDSAFMVGLVGSMRFLGALLGPLTGVIADRGDRRRLLIISMWAMTSVIVALLGLVTARHLNVWYLLMATTIWGVLSAIHQPAQQTMQADILHGPELVNGIALMNTAMNLTSVLGPALAGVLLACCGPATRGMGTMGGVQWSYIVMLGLAICQLWSYCAIRLVQRPPSMAGVSVWQNLLDGMRYSCSHAGLWTALVLAGMVNLVAFPLQFGLMPIFARDVFHVGAAGLGLLGSALGIGSLLGSLLMAFLGAVQHAGRLMLLGTTGWLGLLIVFSLIPHYETALGVLVLMGVAQTFSLTNMTVVLLSTASGEMRGRVMGLRSLAVAPLFLGGTLAGAATTSLGAPITTILCAVLGLLIVVWVAPWAPRQTEG
jgi:MFS family permease